VAWAWRQTPDFLRALLFAKLKPFTNFLSKVLKSRHYYEKVVGMSDPWTEAWPPEGLETVVKCPVCGEADRRTLHPDLVDNVFRVAPGKWILYQCQACQSAYLDPRPSSATIGIAYSNYYTHHATVERNKIVGSSFSLLRRALANGYLNARYGTRYSPSNVLGILAATVFHSKREALDVSFRWLPKPLLGYRLLDIGCGNGTFLLKAREAGWQVVGIDPDPKAIEMARQFGLDTHVGFIDVLDGQAECFDVITLSHVIEHIHDPRAALSAIQRLLKPGGMLYLETPNIQSLGFSIFGKNWRGIESPRHVVLYSICGVQHLLHSCGFGNIELKRRRLVGREMFLKSFRLALGYSPYAIEPKSLPLALALKSWVKAPVSRLEFITLTSRKQA
jgi:2-polyprenyl-3-methyl-5-hydroxy-6-metoxy-1,4-benzoquinol methylase